MSPSAPSEPRSPSSAAQRRLSLFLRRFDLSALSLDFLELLERFIPTEHEMKLIHNYERDGRSLEELSEEDRFMARFGKIPRLSQRIGALTFMGNFSENVQIIQPVSSTSDGESQMEKLL